jgi:hypothetical protein
MWRFAGGLAVLFLIAGPGCGSGGDSSHLGCSRSVAAYCASFRQCPLTWDEVQSGPPLCLPDETYQVADCGGYRKLTYVGTDTGASFYYDPTSGQLVAIVNTSAVGSIQQMCLGGPAEGFTVPSCPRPGPDGGWLDCGPDATGI